MVAVARKALVLAISIGWTGMSTAFALQSSAGGVQAAAPQPAEPVGAQAAQPEGAKVEDRPLPDIPTLMHAVETNQRESEKIEKDYLYKSVQTAQESDGHGGVKKTETTEYDVFWVEGVPVRRMTKKNGKDLSAEEQKKESEDYCVSAVGARKFYKRKASADEWTGHHCGGLCR